MVILYYDLIFTWLVFLMSIYYLPNLTFKFLDDGDGILGFFEFGVWTHLNWLFVSFQQFPIIKENLNY